MKVASINEWKGRRRRSGEVSPACPACFPGAPLFPSRPIGFFERCILSWLGKSPFRCRQCDRRVWLAASDQGQRLVGEPSQNAVDAAFHQINRETFDQVIGELRRAERALRRSRAQLAAVGGGSGGSDGAARPNGSPSQT